LNRTILSRSEFVADNVTADVFDKLVTEKLPTQTGRKASSH